MIWIFAVLLIFLSICGVGVFFGAPFVPTRKIWISDALKLAQISKNDVVVDLGSGNGEVLEIALKYGAKRAVGYEINPLLAIFSRAKLRKFRGKFEVKIGNIFNEKLPRDATVIYIFQVEKVLKKIPEFIKNQRKNLDVKKLKVVVFGFELAGEKPLKKLNGMRLYEF